MYTYEFVMSIVAEPLKTNVIDIVKGSKLKADGSDYYMLYSPDGNYLAIGFDSKTILTWLTLEVIKPIEKSKPTEIKRCNYVSNVNTWLYDNRNEKCDLHNGDCFVYISEYDNFRLYLANNNATYHIFSNDIMKALIEEGLVIEEGTVTNPLKDLKQLPIEGNKPTEHQWLSVPDYKKNPLEGLSLSDLSELYKRANAGNDIEFMKIVNDRIGEIYREYRSKMIPK